MHNQGAILLAIAIPNFILGLFILLRNIHNKANLLFAGSVLSSAFWSFGLAGFIFTNRSEIAIWWARGYYTAAALIAFFFAIFSIYFTGQGKRIIVLLSLLPLVVVLAIIFGPQSWMLTHIEYHDWGKEIILNRNGYIAYSLYFLFFVLLGFQVLGSERKHARGIYKVYLNYLSLGLAIAFLLGAAFNLFLPAFGNYRYIWVGPLFTMVNFSCVSYAIIKHKLFDVRLIVARSIAYALVVTTLSIIFAGFLLGVTSIFFEEGRVPLSVKAAYLVISLLMAVLFQPIKRAFDKATNDVFFRDAYDPQIFLDELNRSMVANFALQPLLGNISSVIVQNLKVQYCSFIFEGHNNGRVFGENPTGHLGEVSIDTISSVPMDSSVAVIDFVESLPLNTKTLLEGSNMGAIVNITPKASNAKSQRAYMLVGIKKSGNPFTKQDSRVLGILANEVAIAVQNSFQFQEIQEFNLTLQEKVQAATRELRAANAQLRELDASKDEFISMASHQLRTPLTAIKGYLSMVVDGDAGPITLQERQMLQRAFDSAEQMVFLISDLLNVSRLQTGKFVIENKPTDLLKIVDAEVEQLQDTASHHKLKLVYNRPNSYPLLNLDETKIRQVVMNFLDNAIYYTPAGGTIEVRLEATPDSVSYTVTDTGVGVPPSEQHHLFTKFYRAGNAKKMRPDGTGLGLFMAKKIIVAESGAIIFKSAEGKGSTFGFSFPRAAVEAKPSSPSTRRVDYK